MLGIDRNKAGISMECTGCAENARPIVPNDTYSYPKYFTKHVEMLRGSRIVLVCVECDRRTEQIILRRTAEYAAKKAGN